MLTSEGDLRLSQLRAKRGQGVELTLDEMREVVQIIAAGRRSAAAASAGAKRKLAAGVVRSAEDLLRDLPGAIL